VVKKVAATTAVLAKKRGEEGRNEKTNAVRKKGKGDRTRDG
jgi:hypothetical protein